MGIALVFWLGEQGFGLPLEAVDRVVRAVAVTPVPRVPAPVSGVVDVGGEVVPVIDVRRHIGLPPRDMLPCDQLLLAQAGGRPLALWVDRAGEVVSWDPARLLPAADGPGLRGIARGGDDLILVLDLEAFLAADALRALDELADHG